MIKTCVQCSVDHTNFPWIIALNQVCCRLKNDKFSHTLSAAVSCARFGINPDSWQTQTH